MSKFKLVLLVALLFGGFPAVSGACDGLFSRVAENRAERKERRSESVLGFGLVKARPTVTATTVSAPKSVPKQAPTIRCVNGQCFKK